MQTPLGAPNGHIAVILIPEHYGKLTKICKGYYLTINVTFPNLEPDYLIIITDAWMS